MSGTGMIVAIVAITVGAWMIVQLWQSFFGWLQSDNNSGSSLRTSELEAIIQGAVREATRPLEKKIERLESNLDHRPLLDDPEYDPEYDPQKKPSGEDALEERVQER